MLPGAYPRTSSDVNRPHGLRGYPGAAVGETITYLIELLVGLACLGLAAVAWRRGGVAARAVATVVAAA
ncbi:MAG: hypothetical protein ACXWWX_04420, partial [Actinomycetota bacterium]